MRRREFLAATAACISAYVPPKPAIAASTEVAIDADRFLINGKPSYAGRHYQGLRIEGLLMNSRMIQGIFDDANLETRDRWAYPDTKKWDANRNTREFVEAMPEWRRHGLLSFTVNLQGGSPEGYSKNQPWDNSGIAPDGALKPEYIARLSRILDRADQLGMAPIVGIFYFGQDQRVRDEASVKKAVENTVEWILRRGYRNVLLEVDNECNSGSYDHAILRADRVHELIELAKSIRFGGRRMLVGTSYGGGKVPLPNVVKTSDFLLMHGNGVSDPARITAMVSEVRKVEGYRTMPVVFNEDDHFDFEKRANNMMSALESYASWGYFDPGESNYRDGYQCPPVNWGINTERKRAFFGKVKQLTGA